MYGPGHRHGGSGGVFPGNLVTLAGLAGSPLAGREHPVSVGSDYQVYVWLREDSVDAGIVSRSPVSTWNPRRRLMPI